MLPRLLDNQLSGAADMRPARLYDWIWFCSPDGGLPPSASIVLPDALPGAQHVVVSQDFRSSFSLCHARKDGRGNFGCRDTKGINP